MHSQHSVVVAPALMASEWDSLAAQIELIAGAATHAQIDVMDGRLVPSQSFPYNATSFEGRTLPHTDSIFFEVHLMVQDPEDIGHQFITAGVRRVIAQIEGFRDKDDALRVSQAWKATGAEVGVSLLLDTPLEEVAPLIDSGAVSVVQVMSIARIGYQGEAFDERALVRIAELRERYPDVTISVDGGVNANTIAALRNAGANMFGIGSAIMKTDNPKESLMHLQELVH